MIVKVKRLSEKAILPKYNNPTDSGMDFYIPEDFTINPGESKEIELVLTKQINDEIYLME